MGLYQGLCEESFENTNFSQNYGLWENYETSSKKKKERLEYWQICEIVYSHFLIEN